MPSVIPPMARRRLGRLTDHQLTGLRFIAATLARTGMAPSLAEITAGLGYSNKSMAFELVEILEREGYLVRPKTAAGTTKSRALVLTRQAMALCPLQMPQTWGIPVLGAESPSIEMKIIPPAPPRWNQ